MKKNLVFVALAGMMLAGCNGGGTATKDGAVSADSVVAEATEVVEVAKWDTIDWDAKSMPIYVAVDNKYGGKFIPYDSANIKNVMPVASTYKTFSSAKGKFAMKYEGYDKGAGASINYNISNRWAAGFKYDVSGAVNKNKEWDQVCGMGFNEEFLKSHEVLDFKGYDSWQDDYWDKVRKDVPEAVKQKIKAKYPGRKLVDCMCGGKTKDGKVQVYSVELDRIGKKCLGLRVVIDGDSMYVKEDEAEYDAANYSAWRVDDEGHYNNLKVLAITRGKDGIDLFYDDNAPESTCIGVIVLRGGKMYQKDLFNYYNYVDFIPQTEAVDLGLSVKWVSQNIGANGEEREGFYYSWGRTEHQYKDYIDESSPAFGKIEEMKAGEGEILDAKCNLRAKYDIATERLGKGWRMPTKEEFQELIDKCEWEVETIDNWYKVCKVKAKNGNCIYLPAGGMKKDVMQNGTVKTQDELYRQMLSYWTATFDKENGKPYSFSFDLTANMPEPRIDAYFGEGMGTGMNVRAVYDGK